MIVELSPQERLRYVVLFGLLLAVAFIANGVYVFATGFQPPGFGRRLPSARPMGLFARLWAGLIPSCIGASIFSFLIIMAAKRHTPPLTVVEWIKMRLDSFPGIICLGGMGIWSLIHPEMIVKWVHESRQTVPDEKEQPGELLIIRMLSAVLLIMAFFFLAITLWAPPNVP